MMLMKVVGLDLAGSEKRDTGFCAMDSRKRCRTSVLHGDAEIISEVLKEGPAVVSIDAPLFLPRGRKSIEDRGPPHFRECDKELMRMRIRFFPISLGPMRMLLTRGVRLRAVLEGKGLEVIETYPGAVQDILSITRKQVGLDRLADGLIRRGVAFGRSPETLNGDELDAVTCALVALMYKRGEYTALGDPAEGLMILPQVEHARSSSNQR